MKLFNRNKEIIQLEQSTQLTFTAPVAAVYHKNEAAEFALQQICCKGLLQVLLPMGLEEKQSNWSVNNLAKIMDILPKYDRLFVVLIDTLKQTGFITETTEGIAVTEQTKQTINYFKLENAIQQLAAEEKAYEPHGNLIKVCIQSLQAILTGKIAATDVIFPGGSLELVTNIYQGNYGADYFNDLLANMVATSVSKAIDNLPAGEKIKILEVGAGTGGSSEVIFKKLDAYKNYIEYVFTDVSKSFLIYAEDKFKTAAPYLKTSLFNIEQSPRTQGLPIGEYDIIFGANVVHATKNIADTLANIKALLKKDGLLMLSEIAKTDIFTSLSFGLLDGWWLYEDQELRLEGSPGLSAENWQMVLTEAGFNEPSSWPAIADLSQQIIVAKSNGLVMLKTSSNENLAPQNNIQKNQTVGAKQSGAAQANAEKYLKKVFATVLKMDAGSIDITAPFENLGIDSLMIGSLTKEFSKDFGNIPATTFFEYRNISELSEYFLENHADFFAPKETAIIATETTKTEVVQKDLPIINQTKNLEKTIEFKAKTREEDIAIIGLSGRYPGAKNLTEFWNNLKAGKDSITEIPKDRWDNDVYFNEEKGIEGRISSRFGGFIDGVAEFDPLFFNISPKEAERMDPQERLFLQTVWETIEDAGYTTSQLSSKKDNTKTGVYVGVMYEEYQLYGVKTSTTNAVVVGGSPASIANRVSYCCDFSGPSMAIDTMCSSSLTAIHLACKDLRCGDADVAIAGGVNVSIHPNKYLALSQANFLSTRGKCESFGNGGDGFIPGEGVGAVLLKPLIKAIADGDHIYGVIKGSAINHGGKTNGYTVPSPRGQASVVKNAIEKAGVKGGDFSYIEAHGTGTSLGDPIEMAGLTKAFGTDKKQFCSIGSVKSNIGHCESAAGISGLTKVLLQLKYKQLVPSLHAAKLNPSIDFENSPFKVQQQLAYWSTENNQLRLAGISSFGAGGSNAHIVIQEYPQTIKSIPLSSPAIILLSAKNKERLSEQVANLKKYLLENEPTNIANIAFTLQTGREQMVERLAIVAEDKATLTEKLTDYLAGRTDGVFTGNIKKEKVDIFITGKAGEAYIKEAIKSKEPESLAQLWVKGVVIDWMLLYPDATPSRISLPTYPFAKEHYWITKAEFKHPIVENVIPVSSVQHIISQPKKLVEANVNNANGSFSSTPTTDNLLYIPIWERVKPTELPITNGGGKHLLVTGRLQNEVINDAKRLLADEQIETIAIAEIGNIPTGITDIYLLQGLVETKNLTIAALIEQQEMAVFNSIKKLLASAYRDQHLNITILTAATQKVLATDNVQEAGSGIIGLAGSLAKEQPHWKLRVVDLENITPSTADVEKVFSIPFDKNGAVTGFRRGLFYQRTLSSVQLSGKQNKLRTKGTYIILGGAGGIGKVTTAYLLSKYNAKVIWLGRKTLDDTINASLDEMAQYGVRPLYFSCDANDKQAVENVYQQIKALVGEVNGLFHSAIVLNDKLLVNMSEADFKQSFLPKSLASHYFVEAFKNEPLDFICYYSSAQSQINAPGQANYSAGCTYKDSFAQRWSAKNNVPSYIINWGYWGEVGIVSGKNYQEQLASMGVGSINAAEGMDILEKVLNSNQPQIMAIKLLAETNETLNGLNADKQFMEANQVSAINFKIPQVAAYQSNEEAEYAFRELCSKGLLQILLQMGFEDKQQADAKNNQQLRIALGIHERHERLFNEMLRAESEVSYIKKVNNKWIVSEIIKQELEYFDLVSAVDGLVAGHKEYEPHANLLKVCLLSMKEILTGKIAATSVMFPKGRLDLVMGIYKGNYQTDYFNDLLAGIIERSVAAALPNLKVGEKIKILEVGAGTGGSSQVIFKHLAPHKNFVEYTYTDLSKSFLFHAEDNFKDMAPYLKTALFNIEQHPQKQNLPLGEYDLIIGANVVHATKNITHTLSNIKALLKKDGLLILNELAQTVLFPTLTFGLLDGWWLYEDVELRLEGSPGLSAAGWETALNETGFTQPVSFPEGVNAGQQIVMAKSNGTIQLVAEKPAVKIVAAPLVAAIPTKKISKKIDSNWLVNQLVTIAAETIKLPKEEFDVEEKFMDYGFDSILGNTLMKNINEGLGITLKPTDIFSYPNITMLAGFIFEAYGDKIQASIAVDENSDMPMAIDEIEEKTSNEIANNVLVNKPLAKDIAIIGISGQFGSANNLDEFWAALKDGKSLITEVPAERWDVNEHYSADKKAPNKTYCKWGGFLNDIDKFDPRFFKISGSEAENMDPQQRFFLQHCWKAIEDAAINPQQLKASKCGVYVGVGPSDYMSSMNGAAASAMWGNASSILAARISYLLDLKGPAVSIDTACSSSLVAMNLGCSSLLNGDTDLIISGGVTIMSSINFYTVASKAGMLSADGKCYAFDSRANGFVPGEGVGVVIMKRLEDAERDGDHIYGVIKGSLINQDGTTNSIIAPSTLSQKQLEEDVYTKYNIHPETISYVEAHGTGTSLGDPIEFEALTGSFKSFTQQKQFCGLGSVKTNVGHTLMAAGAASMIKILLALKHQQLPPSINFQTQNPLIDLANSPFKMQEKLEAWLSVPNKLRRAAISSFGFSGTNAHMIVEEYKPTQPQVFTNNKPALIVLSAKNTERLNEQAENLKTYLKANSDTNMHDIAYTLQIGREAMDERLAIIVNDKEELTAKLSGYLNGNKEPVILGKKGNPRTVSTSETDKNVIENAVRSNDFISIANAWVNGTPIDWNLLYKTNKPQKISLPTYPFAKERFWIHPQVDKTVINGLVNGHVKVNPNFLLQEEEKLDLPTFAPAAEIELEKIISRTEIITELIGVFSKGLKLPKEEFGETIDLQEYGIDSILTMQLLQMAEDHFSVEIEIDDLMASSTLGDLANVIEHKLKNNSGIKVPTIAADKADIAVELQPNLLFKNKFEQNYIRLLPYNHTHFINYKGINLEVMVSGIGKETLVMLPPIDCTATAWMAQFNELQKKYTIIVPHYPGYGLSEFKSSLATLSRIADSIIHILEVLGIKNKVHLVGWSMGGFIAQILAERYPEHFQSITLVNTTSKLEEASTVSNGNLMFDTLRRDFTENLEKLEKTPFMGIDQTSIKGSFNNQVSMFYALQVLDHDYREQLSAIDIPVLIIAGGKDKLSPPRYAKHIHQQIQGSQYVELKSAQHYIPLFHAQFFNRQLLRFLEENKVREMVGMLA